ncbi:TIGR01620 family protein [Terrihabitans rhizophilus]|uniref:TIGR01620 family protein n=1 Tax=Terrihabitans rhizophilus TaxID=3092662 RepID=A0ABU4RQE4_9HYPH|nr:TIGR01620 family protein [Terrihabitans sp. PJ23]MDX6807052.1 TIGR01620 family protein [Terrihabitans sp. PJ23]
MQPPRRPATFRLDDPELILQEAEPDTADLLIEPLPQNGEIAATSAVATATAPRRRPLATLFWTSLSGLVSLGFGLAVTALVEDLFARSQWLGWIGVGLVVLFVLALVLIIGRELLALRRLGRIDGLRARAEAAVLKDDRALALGVVDELVALYSTVPATARGRSSLQQHRGEVIDGADLVHLAERELMTGLDAEARRIVSNASKRVAAITAVAPRAVIDIAVVAATSAALIRGIAGVYGGRPGTIGFFRLIRHVLAHLAVTGGMAAGESVIDQLVGHGIAAKLSARLGEGVINGILTARIGLAAIAVCRPLPFSAREAPTLRDVAGGLFEGKKPG